MRSTLAGFLSGTILSGTVLAGLSLLNSAPGLVVPDVTSNSDTASAVQPETAQAQPNENTADADRAPETAAVDVPAGSAFDTARDDTAPQAPGGATDTAAPEGQIAQLDIPDVTGSAPETQSNVAPAAKPAITDANVTLTTPDAPVEAGVATPEAPAQPEISRATTRVTADLAQPTAPDTGPSVARFDADRDAASSTLRMTLQSEGPETTEDTDTSGTIGDLAGDVTTNRLPSIGQAADETAAASQDETAEDAVQSRDDLPPLERNAAVFERPQDKPLMSIVLIDEGGAAPAFEALADFPYPISFAIDVTRPDAAEAAERYRDAGHEVLAMTDLPEGARAQDAEVAMATYLQVIPQAVAVFEGGGTGLQGNRELSEQLGAILLESGHGLVMRPKGLNTAQKMILRQGVPAATVFREFDNDGQNERAIRRFLDQAAFRAAQEEQGIIMLGRLRPQTISALVLWGLQDRANSVALAPVSAVLKDTAPQSEQDS